MQIEKDIQVGTAGQVHMEVGANGIAIVSSEVGYPQADHSAIKAKLELAVDIVGALKIAAASSENKVDDAIVAMVALAFGRAV